ncbi:GNAT family N-acetyltransferase [Paenibacillus tepidiphilus]|uniref:GNAT family N-acetyltransferase n=1 Tax=Paenibacillus tepidiphilus TaxID=2608683 RepID=UPI00123ABA55|nr:GNAT family N-acetyltransferase [Paenibacillus tepidiphilus]
MALEWHYYNEHSLNTGGIYCLRSKPKSPGFIKKTAWTVEAMAAGLQYLLVKEDGKPAGFIEYTPGEQAWRALYADGYLVIHCLWTGLTGQGIGSALIARCVEEARRLGKHGVAVVTNADTSWAPGPEIFRKHGFIPVDEAAYGFELYAYKLEDAPSPYFPRDWSARLERLGEGLTILRSEQCPYIEVACANVLEAADALDIPAEVVLLASREAVLELSPTPYGIFSVVYNGELIAYHRLTPRSFAKKLQSLKKEAVNGIRAT